MSIIRAHFVGRVMAELRFLAVHAQTPRAALYAGSLMKIVRQMRDLSQDDPFLQVLLSLHDAMAYDNNWAGYSRNQYETASRILKKLADRNVRMENSNKAIAELNAAGFDAFPFVIDFD